MVIEVIAGIMTNALILIADAGHMVIDASSLILSLFAINLAKKPADQQRTYGYQRIQVIAAFINSMTLLVTTIWIFIEAVKRFLHPEPILGKWVIIMALIGLLVNGFSIYLLNRSAKGNINIRSAIIHILGDLLGYLAAVITGIIVNLTNWNQIDPILSTLFALLMIRSAWVIAKSAAHILMEGIPDGIDIDKVTAELKQSIPEILDIHHVHIWSLSHEYLLLTAHIQVAELSSESYKIIQACKALLTSKYNITHATIELEQLVCSDN